MPRQEHPGLDLGQHGGHQQVFAGELEVQLLHQLDVLHVLPRDVRDRDIEDVEILAPDHVEEQVERTLECLEEHLERLGRDVEVPRHLRDRLAIHDGERHLALLRRQLAAGGASLGLEFRRIRSTVLQAHGLADFGHCRTRGLPGALAALADDATHELGILLRTRVRARE